MQPALPSSLRAELSDGVMLGKPLRLLASEAPGHQAVLHVTRSPSGARQVFASDRISDAIKRGGDKLEDAADNLADGVRGGKRDAEGAYRDVKGDVKGAGRDARGEVEGAVRLGF